MNDKLRFSWNLFSNVNFWYCSTTVSSLVFAFFFYKKFRNYKNKTVPEYPIINEVLFFTEKYAMCYDHVTYKSTCDFDDCGLRKLKKIIEYLDSATESLDVCVYTITSQKLADIILQKFRQGVKVRIITDGGTAFGDGSQIPLFRKNGVLIRARQSTQFLMHHKFAIVDKCILVNGSFNWTAQATFGNWENVYITNYPASMVQKYCEQFEELWCTLCN